jgi:hypothetical protein
VSALRLGRLPDGTRDIRVIDDGAPARLHASRMGIKGGYGNPVLGGSLPVALSRHDREKQYLTAKAKRLGLTIPKPPPVLCGWTMTHGYPCARTAEHGGEHQSRAAMDHKAAYRRGRP